MSLQPLAELSLSLRALQGLCTAPGPALPFPGLLGHLGLCFCFLKGFTALLWLLLRAKNWITPAAPALPCSAGLPGRTNILFHLPPEDVSLQNCWDLCIDFPGLPYF